MAVQQPRTEASLLKRLRPAPMPSFVTPMLCTLVDKPFDLPDWIFETKFDGLRILGRFNGNSLTMISRNEKPQDFQFPDVAKALRASLKRPAIVDGEIVCFDDEGRSSFRALQQRFHIQSGPEVQLRMRRFPAFLYIFDLLYWDRNDVTALPLEERKKLLRKAVRWSNRIRWTEGVPEHGSALFKKACAAGLEGIIAKRLNSTYLSGRSHDWLKIKCLNRQEFVIGGFTDPQRSRAGFGALLVGYFEDGALAYAGKVGTGFSTQILLDLRRRLEKISQETSPFDKGAPLRGHGVHWVQPRLVAEVAFSEWTQNGQLRQPRYEGLRPDKKPRECRRERPKHEEDVTAN
jgi:bifunctional non-homologous end joining protein LigD